MHSRKPFYLVVALLFIVGLSASIYRGIEHNVPFLPGEQYKVGLSMPKSVFRVRVARQKSLSPCHRIRHLKS